ncbi:hypothetical protein JG687_00014522 [Phytophthora cactorum]|uniref:Uncharacterized protein n=1 Tax=Phytophthora cactorum TaxID=29920 RepID=A0A8T1U0M2_9STRA|nr:hypothetical protein PC120_g20523 [Phytophthora cactorum]KAG3047545.1 hypothetical protein PC121_g19994 [Phytophthora cactorum]KAG4047599.1 hypothetical protein PC123_g17053 [Phytophthora cactorum]KAG6949969.1 hypothetical protein JG687_00014522 [Phytophthora cactorum]
MLQQDTFCGDEFATTRCTQAIDDAGSAILPRVVATGHSLARPLRPTARTSLVLPVFLLPNSDQAHDALQQELPILGMLLEVYALDTPSD